MYVYVSLYTYTSLQTLIPKLSKLYSSYLIVLCYIINRTDISDIFLYCIWCVLSSFNKRIWLWLWLDGSWCKNVAEKFNLTDRQTDGIAMPIAERSYVIRYVKLLAMHGRRNRGSRVSGCSPNFWGAGAVLPRNLHFYVNLSFVVFRLFNHTSHCCTLCSRKHVTTFLMISWSKTVRLENFWHTYY